MAVVLGNALNFAKNEIQNARVQNLASAPSSPVEGQVYYHTGDKILYVWNGTAWRSTDAAASGSYTDEVIEDLVAAMFTDSSEFDFSYTDNAGGHGTITGALIAASIVNAKLANMPTLTIKGNNTGGSTTPLDLTAAQVKTLLAIVPGDVTGFDTQVRTNRLDQMAAPTADLSINTHKLTGVVDPTSAQDAATKAYVDSVLQGLSAKTSVRVATTAAGTLASSFANGSTVDGVTLATGDRILIKDQAAPAANGIYVVAASGAPTRAVDMDSSAEVAAGLYVFVEEGTANGDSGWVLTTDGAITIGTTSLAFVQFTGAGQITAGSGLTKTGNTLDVQVDGSSIEINADTLRVKAGGVTDAMLSSTFAKKFSGLIGDGSTTAIVVTHNLGTRDVHITVYDATTYEEIIVDKARTTTNTATITFAVAPASNAYRVVITG